MIASRTGGFGETVDDGVSGLLFPNGDDEALYQCLESIALGRAFPRHQLDADIISRCSERHGMARHVAAMHAALDRARPHVARPAVGH